MRLLPHLPHDGSDTTDMDGTPQDKAKPANRVERHPHEAFEPQFPSFADAWTRLTPNTSAQHSGGPLRWFRGEPTDGGCWARGRRLRANRRRLLGSRTAVASQPTAVVGLADGGCEPTDGGCWARGRRLRAGRGPGSALVHTRRQKPAQPDCQLRERGPGTWNTSTASSVITRSKIGRSASSGATQVRDVRSMTAMSYRTGAAASFSAA